ncbi:MAG: hypothetical protein IPH33_14475 [Bacteroidetes bacterium]|nr:hypothetical protein [Bacteroidota bacterium]
MSKYTTSESANLKTLTAAITTSETATTDVPIANGGYLVQGRWSFGWRQHTWAL